MCGCGVALVSVVLRAEHRRVTALSEQLKRYECPAVSVCRRLYVPLGHKERGGGIDAENGGQATGAFAADVSSPVTGSGSVVPEQELSDIVSGAGRLGSSVGQVDLVRFVAPLAPLVVVFAEHLVGGRERVPAAPAE